MDLPTHHREDFSWPPARTLTWPRTKVSGFAAALMLATEYPEASWCIYPIAVTHPLDYSEGCSEVAVLPDSAFAQPFANAADNSLQDSEVC